MNNYYSTATIAQITGLTIKQLDYWNEQGIFVPSIKQSNGPGSKRQYSIEDLIQLKVLKRIRDHGWSTQKIRDAKNKLSEIMNNPDPLKHCLLIHSKGILIAVFKTEEGERVMFDALSSGGQQIMSIALDILQEETLKSVSQLM